MIIKSNLCGHLNDSGIFWDSNLTFDSDVPDFTSCFENTLLLWTVFGIFSLVVLFYIPYIASRTTVNSFSNRGLLYWLKIVKCLILFSVSIGKIIVIFTKNANERTLDSKIEPFIRVVVSILLFIIIDLEFRKGYHTSSVLSLFLLFYTLLNIIILRTNIIENKDTTMIVLVALELSVTGLLFFNFLFADKKAIPWLRQDRSSNLLVNERTPLLNDDSIANCDARTGSSKKPFCPESSSSFFAVITHFWILPLLIKGYKKYLNFEDLFDIPEKEKCSAIVPKFLEVFEERYNQIDKNKPLKDQIEGLQYPLRFFFMLIKSCKGLFLTGGLCRLIIILPDISASLLLRVLLQYLQSPYETKDWHGHLIAVAMFLNMMILSLFHQLMYKFNYLTAQRMRSVMMSSVFRKSLRLSAASRSKSTSGEINNLMSVDAQKIHDMMLNLHEIWASPLTVLVTLYFMWQVIGPSCLAGFGFLALMAPFTGGFLAAKYAKMEAQQMALKDIRLKHMNEILSGIKMLKYYAWEISFAKKVTKIRKDELKTLRKQALLNVGLGLVWYAAPFCVAFVIFATYILSSKNHHLDPEKTFVTLSFISLLNFSLSFLPMLLGFSAQAYVSLGRICKLLTQEEMDPNAVGNNTNTFVHQITIENGNFTWGDADSKPVLKDVNLTVKTGSLLAVVGRVGSGKSSLASSLLGELRVLSGKVNVSGTTAYLSQQAWIQNASLKQNVQFINSFNKDRYDRVIEACALKPDLEQLTAGDLTEIGEKGINLSGGQKQRVALARAVYSKADVFILDDPLSAVDAHVGQKIFQEVLGRNGLLKGKTRVLVTHAINVLPECDKVIMIENGRIIGKGTYAELLRTCPSFVSLVQESQLDENSDEDYDKHSEEETEEQADKVPRLRRRTSRQKSCSIDQERKLKTSVSLTDKSDIIDNGRLIEEETEDIGSIKRATIVSYMRAGSFRLVFCLIITAIVYVGVVVFTNWWLSYWSDMPQNTTRSTTLTMLGVYGALGIGQVITIASSQCCVLLGAVLASKILHEKLLWRILKAPMTFFDTTPLGRILNRFSSDMERIDCAIPELTSFWIGCLTTLLSTIIGVSLATPQFLIAAIPLAFSYWLIQHMYIKSVRQLKRIDSVRKSPIYTSFDEALAGVSIIRAFKVSPNFIRKNDTLVNNSMIAWYPILTGQRWLGVALDVIGAIAIFSAAFLTVYLRHSGYLTPGLAGMSLNFAIETSYTLSMLVRGSTDLETNIVSVERIQEYSQKEQEAEWREPATDPIDWPSKGNIELHSVCVRYRPNLPLVLNEISLKVNSGEKIGIVGRTGAGKSSLASVLFRIIELSSGKITIDGVDISKIGLHSLREKITIIPQDPVLFEGTLRENLDPFENFSDDEIWQCLEISHLKSHVEEQLEKGLDYECGEGGKSLSVGQRQLVCLARALLRNSKILVMDEATASVDPNTDSLIQQTIRQAFANSTVLTIAHRLVTIMDYDRVIVLGLGRLLEEGTPTELLSNEQGEFYKLATEAGLAIKS